MILQPILIGGAAGVLSVVRELSPKWPTSGLRRQLYDALLAVLILILFIYVVLKIQTV